MKLDRGKKYILELTYREMAEIYRALCIARDNADFDYFEKTCKQIGKAIEGQ